MNTNILRHSSPNTILSANAGTIFLRPNGDLSGTYEFNINSNGSVSFAGGTINTKTVNTDTGDKNNSGNGYRIGGSTAMRRTNTDLIISSFGGAIYLRPGGTTDSLNNVIIDNTGKTTVGGNLLVTGGVTLYGSDIRYKSIMQQVNLSLMDIAKAPSFVYRWNKKGMKRDRLNLGGSAQYTQTILPWAVEDNDNFLSMDYATVAYTFAVHTARHLLTYESRTDKKIKKLENRVKYLEKQLKS